MNDNQKLLKERNFTIMQTLIASAVAGTILAIILIIAPAAQGAGRNAQRQEEVTAVASSIRRFMQDNQGRLPKDIPSPGGGRRPQTGQDILKLLADDPPKFYLNRKAPDSGNVKTTPTDIWPNLNQIVYREKGRIGSWGIYKANSIMPNATVLPNPKTFHIWGNMKCGNIGGRRGNAEYGGVSATYAADTMIEAKGTFAIVYHLQGEEYPSCIDG